MLFSTRADFVGQVNIPFSVHDTDFEYIANSIEIKKLKDLLGDWLYSKFIADLKNGEPQTQMYIDLLNGKEYTDTNGKFVIYTGLKEMLVKYIFCLYKLQNDVFNTSLNVVQPNNENSRPISRSELIQFINPILDEANRLFSSAFAFINNFYDIYFAENMNEYDFWQPIFEPKQGNTFYTNTPKTIPSNNNFYR